ncbi:8300_t:CDS:1 [Scutellospora calospora]|uniref:8300_t:CDS:1 n=1 Tax=Scutellospora calospora TaxID=85575 RepID=A0ACA9JV12_9GLOM|nr:8300_t:CDS:1 [Scutellospora calospora]
MFLIEENKKNKNVNNNYVQEDQFGESDPEDYAYLTDIIGCVLIDEPTNKINCIICNHKYSSLKNQEIKKHLSTKHSYLWNELERRKKEFLKIEFSEFHNDPLGKEYSIYLEEKDDEFYYILLNEYLIYSKKDNNKPKEKYSEEKNNKIHNKVKRKNIKKNYYQDRSNINNNNNHIYICENVELIMKNNIQIISKKIVINSL